MLDAGRAPQRIEDLTVFFDHAEDHRYYVMWDVPHLVRDPEPRLSLLLFRGAESGGLLQCEVTLAPSTARLEAVERALTGNGRKPILQRPDWRAGTASVAGWLSTAELAPRVLAIGAPSLVGDPMAVIAARLDQSGAALADAAIRGDALPTVVIFDLETLGLAGPLGVEIEADLTALHDRLTAEGALTTPYGRARIAKTWEEAARDNVIRVRVLDESGEVESQQAEAMRRVGEDLLARMFSPFPPPALPPQLRNDTVAPIELSFRLTMRREELETTQRWDFRERRARSIRHYAAASLIGLIGDRDPLKHIAFADLTERPRNALIRVEPELTVLAMSAVEVDVRETGGETTHTVVLTDAAPEVRVDLPDPNATLQYRVRARFDPMRTAARDVETPWLDAMGGLIAVSPRRLFKPRMVSVLIGRAELDWIDHVEVVATREGEPARSLVLDAERHSGKLFFPAGTDTVTLTSHWRGRADEPSATVPPREIVDDIFLLDSPFADSISVLLVPLPRPDVRTFIVEVRVTHEDYVHAKTVTWDAPDRSPRRVGLRRFPNSPRRYSHRIQLIRDDGTIDQAAWKETDETVLTLGADGPVSVRSIDVVLVGGGPASRGSLAMELVLEAGGSRATDVLEGDRDSATLAVVLPPSSARPTLWAREFLQTGEVRETRWVDPPDLTVIAETMTPIP